MSKLHLFCPENDLALAKNLANYTPPDAASRLKRAGECLPLWYGHKGDMFVSTGTNDCWLTEVQRTFGIEVEAYDYKPGGLDPAPWGWSKASRADFKNLGFSPDQLPDDEHLDRIRQLSHRRTSALLGEYLRGRVEYMAMYAVELHSQVELEQYLVLTDSAIFKQPYSSSGRGLVPYDRSEYSHKQPQLLGIIRQQGSIMAEPRHKRISDFALLYTIESGQAIFRGYSLFTTTRTGIYTGNVLMPQEEIYHKLQAEYIGDDFDQLPGIVGGGLEQIIGTDYEGPLGVDMMTTQSGELALCEINLRNTMGHVCLNLYDRYIAPGAHGEYTILPATSRTDKARIFNGRIHSGRYYLNPPGNAFDIVATVSRSKPTL